MNSWPRKAKVAAAAILLALFFLAAWDWNWLKPLAEARASAMLDRDVTIGTLDVTLGREAEITLEAVSAGTLGSIDRLRLRVATWPLLRGRVVLPDIAIERLRAEVRPGPSGAVDWSFGLPAPVDPDSGLEIGTLSLHDGEIRFVDAPRKSDFRVLLRTEPARAGKEAQIVVTAKGTYSGQPVTASLNGAAVLLLRNPADPYTITATAENGPTRIALHGTLLDPLRFGGANVVLELQGNDASALFPLTGIPLPPTPPYKLKGALDYRQHQIRFTGITGTVGTSDIAGDVGYVPPPRDGEGRAVITANLVSKKAVLADLAGFIGATPGKADAPNQTPGQKVARRKEESKPSLLPDLPINLPKLRYADFHVRYKGERIETEHAPLDDISVELNIVDGKLTLHPLSLGVGTGRIVMNVVLDGRGDQVHAVADVDFRKVDLRRIMEATRLFKGAGTVGGRGRIHSTGNSLKSLLGRGDGELQLFMTGGNLSAILVDLAGLDLGNAVLSLVGIPRRTALRCMIADFGLANGQIDTRTLLVDTTEANIIGSGTVNLTDETIDYTLETEPKRRNIASLRAPIRIRGPLKSPRVAPEGRALAARAGAAVVLGVLLTPLAALIPTLQRGLGEDNDCVALLKTVGAPPSPPPPATRGKARDAK